MRNHVHEEAGPAPVKAMNWEMDVAVGTHPLMLIGYARIVAISILLTSGLLVFLMVAVGNGDHAAPLIGMMAVIGFGLFLFMLLIALTFYRNRMRMAFSVDAIGASALVVDRRAKAASQVAIVVGTLAADPGLAGAGLIAASTSRQSVNWRGIESARFYPRWRAIALANSWRNVLILFCRDDNYQSVADAVRMALAARPLTSRKNSPLPRLLLRTALAVAATAPLFWLPDNLEIGAFPPFIILCFALATIWLVPLLAWVVIGGLLLMFFGALINGFALGVSLFGEGLTNYSVLNGDDWARLALALLGGGYLLWLSIATLRGRIASALAGDQEDGYPKA